MPLVRYWPTRDEINRCIKAEAESASDAVILAVHQPMPLVRRDEGSGIESQASEQELLEAFLSEDLPQGTLLMPITGPSGSGKSHLVRWLAAQLGRDPRACDMHVIRIPKSASLRYVVECVLEPLADDPRFGEVRKSLDNAIAKVTPFAAAVRFSGALEVALKDLRERLISELRAAPPESERRRIRARADHAGKLPGFLNDAALRDHMTENVLAPIVQRAVKGRTELAPGEDESLPQFHADDLRIPAELHGALGQAAAPVQTYYQTVLNRADGAGREEAADVLNEIVDQAIQQVFQLDQATGGVTLESIILRVRELLLELGKELVLLVEDFAALSGIQQVLLNVCIQEAEYEGRQVRSRMRTALALTDGYLVGRDTIATRARQEWVIRGSENEDVIRRTIDLVGAYLNAARWGEEALKRQYQQSPRDSATDLTGWVEIFEDEDLSPAASEQLMAFGKSARGVPLFPYNNPAVGLLAKRHLREAGRIRFNPRRVINFILRDVLLPGRSAFQEGYFPPAGFQDARAPASIAGRLSSEALSEDERRRLEAVLVYWGGTEGDSVRAVPKEIFAAFGLQVPSRLGDNSSVVGPERVKPRPSSSSLTPDSSTRSAPRLEEDEQVTKWRQTLESWVKGTELTQQDANKLRNVLRRSVERAIPWNGLRLSGRCAPAIALRLPNARGTPSVGIPLLVAEDHTDPDGELRQTFLGAIRLDLYKGQDYAEADEDSARLANLVERLLSDLTPHLDEVRRREARVLCWILECQSRVLGLLPRTRMAELEARMERVRAQVTGHLDRSSNDLTDRWQALRHEAEEMRPELQKALWSRIGCFQGDGDTPYALDPALVDSSDLEESSDLNFLNAPEIPRGLLTSGQSEHLAKLKPIRIRATTRPLVELLRKFSGRLDELVGAKHDKQSLISTLGSLLDSLEPIGVWPQGYSRKRIRQEIESFRNDDVSKQLQEAGPLLDEDSEVDLAANSTLDRLGRLKFSVVDRADVFLSLVEDFVGDTERDLDVKQRELIGIDPTADADSLSRLLDQIDRDLRTIAGGMPA